MMCKSNFKKFFCAIIVGLVISLFQDPLLVCASSTDSKTVKVGYYENDIFQEGAAEGAVKTGYAYEYYMKLSEYTGWKYEYVYGSFNDLYQQLKDGDIDLLAGLAYKEEREEYISYPDVAMGSETYNLVKREDNTDINSDSDSINGHSIGVMESAVSTALDAYLISHELNANVKHYSDMDALIEAFDSGEVDLMATEGAGTLFRKQYEVLLTFGLSDYYVCVSKQKPELLKELNDAQASLFNNEPYFRSELSSKYFTSSVSIQALSPLEREWLDSHDSITVGYLDDYLPYCDTDSTGKVVGVIKDVIPDIFASLNINNISIKYVEYKNYDDMIAAVDTEEIDLAFPVGGGLYYSEQNGIYQTNPLVSISTDLIYKNVVISPNLSTFAVNSNNKMQYYYVKTNYPNAEIVYYDGTEECLKAVLNEEVDCTTLNGLRANEILKNYEYTKLSLRQLPSKDDRCIGVKIGNEGLLRLFNRGIQILGDDYTGNIAYRYVDGLYTYSIKEWLDEHFMFILNSFVAAVILMIVAFTLRLRALQRVNAGLRNSNQNQRLIIDNIAGVLRNSVKEIHDLALAISGKNQSEKLVERSIGRIKESSWDTLRTLDEILDINLIEKKKLVLNQEKANIVDLIKETEQNITPKVEKKHITFSVTFGEMINKDVIVDKARVMQVIEIILLNAINYTPAGGSVSLTAKENRSTNPFSTEFEFTVKDNGIGISEEFQKIAFEPFTKEEPNIDSIANGPGLGLTVAKGIVELMNGSINVKSEKGKGSEVTIKALCKINYDA